MKLVFFRDRFRTSINVLGDSIGAGIIAHLSRHDLKEHEDSLFTDRTVSEESKEKESKSGSENYGYADEAFTTL